MVKKEITSERELKNMFEL